MVRVWCQVLMYCCYPIGMNTRMSSSTGPQNVKCIVQYSYITGYYINYMFVCLNIVNINEEGKLLYHWIFYSLYTYVCMTVVIYINEECKLLSNNSCRAITLTKCTNI